MKVDTNDDRLQYTLRGLRDIAMEVDIEPFWEGPKSGVKRYNKLFTPVHTW